MTRGGSQWVGAGGIPPGPAWNQGCETHVLRIMKRYRRRPKLIATEKLRSYGTAMREVAPSVEHLLHKGLNRSVENCRWLVVIRCGVENDAPVFKVYDPISQI